MFGNTVWENQGKEIGAGFDRHLRTRCLRILAAKTIARIEQGLVRRIQKETLNSIADRLRVKVDKIETY